MTLLDTLVTAICGTGICIVLFAVVLVILEARHGNR